MAWADGMLLEDYYDALAFRIAGKVPPAAKWVDELRHRAAAASFEGLM